MDLAYTTWLLAAEARMRPPRLQTCRLAQSSNQTAMPCSAQGINCLNLLVVEFDLIDPEILFSCVCTPGVLYS